MDMMFRERMVAWSLPKSSGRETLQNSSIIRRTGTGRAPLVYLVGLVVEGLKGAGVEHPHQVIKGAVVVWDDGEHGLLALPHEAQLHIVPRSDAGDLRQDESGKPDSGAQ